MSRENPSQKGDFRVALEAVFQLSGLRWRDLALLVLLTLLGTLFEGFGIAMLYPILQYIEQGGDVEALVKSAGYWKVIVGVYRALSIPLSLTALSGMVFALILLRQAFNYARIIYNHWLSQSVLFDIRTRGFDALLRAGLSFHDRTGGGKAISALTIDGLRGSGAVLIFFKFLSSTLILLVYLAFLAALAPGMTLFTALMMGVVGLILRKRVHWLRRHGEEISQNNDSLTRIVSERLTGIRVIQMAASEDRESRRVVRVGSALRDLNMKLARIVARVEALVDPVVVGVGLLLLVVAVETYGMAVSEIGIFLLVLLRLLPYAKDMLKSRQNFAGHIGSLKAVSELVREARRADSIRGGNRPFVRPEREIAFEDVRFAYTDEGPPALRDVTLSIPAGGMMALVGRSGAGKSTLVDLIPRLREPQAGRILVDGAPIEEYSLPTLRRAIAFVPQDCFLFDDTLADNIRYGRPEASREEVEEAARQAYADEFIEALPEGYETRIGERGLRLSGGQRQRVVLARALLQGAPIVILDEATSALDSESEHYIQKALAEIRSTGKTTLIVIAHRLSTIKTADRIVILDRGSVVACGTHEDLVEQIAWYSGAATAQATG